MVLFHIYNKFTLANVVHTGRISAATVHKCFCIAAALCHANNSIYFSNLNINFPSSILTRQQTRSAFLSCSLILYLSVCDTQTPPSYGRPVHILPLCSLSCFFVFISLALALTNPDISKTNLPLRYFIFYNKAKILHCCIHTPSKRDLRPKPRNDILQVCYLFKNSSCLMQ